MDWTCYKQLCDTPNVFSRWMLEQTIDLLKVHGGPWQILASALSGSVLEKPEDHTGGRATDMFELALSAGEVAAIVASVVEARQQQTATRATRGRGLGGFVEAWQEYERFLGVSQAR